MQGASAEFEIEEYHDPNEAHARWMTESQAGEKGKAPQRQPPPGRGAAGGGGSGGPPNGRPPARQGYPQAQPQQQYAPLPSYPPQAPHAPAASQARRAPAAPGFELPPLVEPAEPRPYTAPRGFARSALGTPPGAAPLPRRKNARPLEANDLEPVSRQAVQVWKALDKAFPAYFHSPELHGAVFDFLRSILGEGAQGARALTLEVRRHDDGSVSSRDFYEPEITIGSHAQNTLQVMSAQVSRKHARIVHDERGYCLVDQGSSNGTYLRGERVQPGYAYPLRNGEVFSIPGHEIQVKWPEALSAPKLAQLAVASIRVEPQPRFFESASAQAQIAVVRLEPAGLRVYIEVDLPLAALAISRVLGETSGAAALAGQGGASGGVLTLVRPLSEVEKGVLELLFVKLLDQVQSRWGERAELTLHLERLMDARDPRAREQAAAGQMIVAAVGLDFDSRRDTVRVALPKPTIAALAPRLESQIPRAGESMPEVLARLRDQVGFARVELRAEAGRSMLSRRELAALSAGDIIVPDELYVKANAETGLAGRVDIAIGSGRGRPRIRGELVGWDGALYHVRIEEFLKGDRAVNDESMQLGDGSESGDVLPEGVAAPEMAEDASDGGAAVLEDVPLPLIVELGRLSLSVRDIAALRRGQVLELGRTPQEPVALVVEGHVIGAGKLVNVEGEIGVQITNLSR